MGIFSQAKAIVLGSQANTDNTNDTNNADASQGSGLKQASTAAASMALGVVGTLGALNVPSLLPTSDGPLKLSPNICKMSLDELQQLGIVRSVEMDGKVKVVHQEDVKNGTVLSFELKDSTDADQGIEVRQLVKGFREEQGYTFLRSLLANEKVPLKDCQVRGYLVRSTEGDWPILYAEQVTLTDPSIPTNQQIVKGQPIAGWTLDDAARIHGYVTEAFNNVKKALDTK